MSTNPIFVLDFAFEVLLDFIAFSPGAASRASQKQNQEPLRAVESSAFALWTEVRYPEI